MPGERGREERGGRREERGEGRGESESIAVAMILDRLAGELVRRVYGRKPRHYAACKQAG
jgi:hypothetical protein